MSCPSHRQLRHPGLAHPSQPGRVQVPARTLRRPDQRDVETIGAFCQVCNDATRLGVVGRGQVRRRGLQPVHDGHERAAVVLAVALARHPDIDRCARDDRIIGQGRGIEHVQRLVMRSVLSTPPPIYPALRPICDCPRKVYT